MKKTFLFLVTVLAVCFTLVACQGGGDVSDPTDAPEDTVTQTEGKTDKVTETEKATETESEEPTETETENTDGYVLQFTLSGDGASYYVSDIEIDDDADINGINVVIPESYEGLPVTAIGEYAFSYCRQMTGISIPGSITNTRYAFG